MLHLRKDEIPYAAGLYILFGYFFVTYKVQFSQDCTKTFSMKRREKLVMFYTVWYKYSKKYLVFLEHSLRNIKCLGEILMVALLYKFNDAYLPHSRKIFYKLLCTNCRLSKIFRHSCRKFDWVGWHKYCMFMLLQDKSIPLPVLDWTTIFELCSFLPF